MPRTARADGFCYHVINLSNARGEFFHKDGDCEPFVQLIEDGAERMVKTADNLGLASVRLRCRHGRRKSRMSPFSHAEAARRDVEESLEEAIRGQATAGKWNLWIGVPLSMVGLVGVIFVLNLSFGIEEELSGPQISKLVRAHVAAWLGLAGGVTELILAFFHVRRAGVLREAQIRWRRGRVPVVGREPVAAIEARREAPPRRSLRGPTIEGKRVGLPIWAPFVCAGGVALIAVVALIAGLMVSGSNDPLPDPVGGAAEVPEGPAPKGWIVLFSSDDPSIWNTDSPGERFAMPVRKAHSAARFLRLKRLDTEQVIIAPVRRDALLQENKPEPAIGYWWNGTGENAWGGRHLGIVQIPPTLAGQRGPIRVSNHDFFTGSGFGHKIHVNDGQYYCWHGREIPKTRFEIAVTCDPLTDAEKRFLAIAGPDEGPPPRGWTVLFRSDDPSIWNSDTPGENFAVPLYRAHSRIKYLRLKRTDTGAALIVPVRRDELEREGAPAGDKGVAWNGGDREEYGGFHLGVIEGPRRRWPDSPRGAISVMNAGFDSFLGSGFGHKIAADDKQYFSWKGREIPKTRFEIAVTADELTDEERRDLSKE
ncbi:MAG: hypothetical protein U0793_16830 [Gemmataceae bacterium]